MTHEDKSIKDLRYKNTRFFLNKTSDVTMRNEYYNVAISKNQLFICASLKTLTQTVLSFPLTIQMFTFDPCFGLPSYHSSFNLYSSCKINWSVIFHCLCKEVKIIYFKHNDDMDFMIFASIAVICYT
jgi:hypothetical protein